MAYYAEKFKHLSRFYTLPLDEKWMPEIREWPPRRHPFDGGPIIHQGFCCPGREG